MGRDPLAGRTALVTGGSGGIGRAAALQLVALAFRTGRESAEHSPPRSQRKDTQRSHLY